MQRIILFTLIISAATPLCVAQEPASPQAGVALKEETTSEARAILDHALSLKDQGKMEEALKIVDDALLKYQEKTYDRYALLTVKFDLLSGLS
jgi:predicted S18 family serine protease